MQVFFFALLFFFVPVILGAIPEKLCNITAQDYNKEVFYSECLCKGSADSLVLELDGEILIDDGRDQPSVTNHPCHFKVYGNDGSDTTISVGCPVCWKERITLQCYYSGHVDRGSGKVSVPGWSPQYPCTATTVTTFVTVPANSSWPSTNDTFNGTAVLPISTKAAGTTIFVSAVVGAIVLIALIIPIIWLLTRKCRKGSEGDRVNSSETETMLQSGAVSVPQSLPLEFSPRHLSLSDIGRANEKSDAMGDTIHAAASHGPPAPVPA